MKDEGRAEAKVLGCNFVGFLGFKEHHSCDAGEVLIRYVCVCV